MSFLSPGKHGLSVKRRTGMALVTDKISSADIVRTKMAIFIFFSNLTQAFDVAPMWLNSEVQIQLPCSEGEWTADNASAWNYLRQKKSDSVVTFSDVLRSLLSPSVPAMLPCSSFGQYVMLHALVQQIWYVRQDCVLHGTTPRLDFIEVALRKWQANWQTNPECSPSPQNPYHALALVAHMLLRYSQLRVHVDMRGMRKALLSHDVEVISRSFGNSLQPTSSSTDLTRTADIAITALKDQVLLGMAITRAPLSLSGLQFHCSAFECCKSNTLAERARK